MDPDPEPEPEPTVYSIKLMLDGEPYKTIDVVDGKLSEELPVLTREGWVFEAGSMRTAPRSIPAGRLRAIWC